MKGKGGRPPAPRYLVIGRVLAPWGVRGEVKIKILTDWPDRFALLERVYLGEDLRPYVLERFRLQKGNAIVKLGGCESREAVERLRGQFVQIPVEEAMPLGEDEYYEYQIIGLDVWTKEGEYLGRVREVIYTGANDVYVVRDEGREVLIPAPIYTWSPELCLVDS
ncbi:MAG TPA: 16S rRNA processing protein RimM, partial [Anaerolineae bacterium]|nr:16S rRNA processing protein RimM [Anaerolineae bacterium]